jgi:hypothetical protein
MPRPITPGCAAERRRRLFHASRQTNNCPPARGGRLALIAVWLRIYAAADISNVASSRVEIFQMFIGFLLVVDDGGPFCARTRGRLKDGTPRGADPTECVWPVADH